MCGVLPPLSEMLRQHQPRSVGFTVILLTHQKRSIMAVEVYHANTKKVLVRDERHPADIAPVFIATARVAQLLHVPQVQRRGGY